MPRVLVKELSASLGEVLRDHRRAAGLTQEELAERAGLSPRSISGLESGDAHTPRRDTVALLLRALGLVGPEREAFEALVERRRGQRPSLAIDRLPVRPAPLPLPLPLSEERPRHNLPRSLTSFVGREQQLQELGRVLTTAPLLTLVGAGGVGKTRLAEELAGQHVADYADGTWLVELACLGDASLIPGAIAAAVGLGDTRARNMTDALTEYLRPRRLLLVLDNCEHLVEACAELVADLLRACPHLQVLATSREPLAIVGEILWRVVPLELPDLDQPQSPELITGTAAVRLFIERARAVNNALVLTEDNARAIARICVGVDGIPLALELAAARTRVLSVEELAQRLEHDPAPTVFGRANRGVLPQHRTIRATIDWSHDLLAEPERVLLRRLSVFAGGWTLHMAEVVCADAGAGVGRTAVLDLLTRLVDKSMVLVDAAAAVARYRLLEPIRQYALERLEASGEATTYRRRHAMAFLELAQTGEADLAGAHEISSLDRIEVEHDNIRAGLRWALTHQASNAALRTSAALFRFWERRGHFQEGCTWLEQALVCGSDAPPHDRAPALNALANLLWRGGDAERARPIAEQALALSRQAGSTCDVAWALVNLGMIAYFRDDPGLAVARLEESVPVARQAANLPLQSLALTFLGRAMVWARGLQNPRATAVLEESLALAVAAQSRYATGHALMALGDLAWQRGDFEQAVPVWRRALIVRSELADRRGIAGCLERLALGLAASDRFESAAWLFGAAEAQHNVLGIGLRHDAETDYAHLVGVTCQHLGDAFASNWAAGRASTVYEAVVCALEDTRGLPSASEAFRSSVSARRWSLDRLPLRRRAGPLGANEAAVAYCGDCEQSSRVLPGQFVPVTR